MGRDRVRERGRTTRWKLVEGFLWNAGAWAVLSFGLHQLPRTAVLWWGLAVAIHGLGVGAKLLAGRRPAEGERAEPVSVSARQPATDPFLAEVEAAIAALEAAAAGRGQPAGVDLAALRSAAAELRMRRLALDALATDGAREKLAAERDEALGAAERAGDPRTAEVLRGQAESVASRLGALEQAAGAAARLAARERTLLHQVEALRLSLLQTGLDESRTPDLAGEVERLRLDLRAEAELESDLARARLGGRLQQRT